MARNSNFELLRIICMVFILTQHFFRNTKWDFDNRPKKDAAGKVIPNQKPYVTTDRHMFVIFMGTHGKIGVQVFMMISGYFQNTKPVKLSSVLRLWYRVVTWTWPILAYMYYFVRPIWYGDFRTQAFPVLAGQYWYVDVYVVIMLISPFLSTIMRHCSQRQVAGGLLVLLATQSFAKYTPMTHKLHKYVYSQTLFFTTIYLVGAYFRQYPKTLSNISALTWAIVLVLLECFNYGTLYYFHNYKCKFVAENGKNAFDKLLLVSPDYAPLALVISIALFCFGRKLDFRSKFVNFVAAQTFGVYILHDNELVRPKLFKDANSIKAGQYYKSDHFWALMIFLPLALYAMCTIAEYLRQVVFGRLENAIVNFLARRIEAILEFMADFLDLEPAKDEHELMA